MDRKILSEDQLDALLTRTNPVNRAALDDESVRSALASVRRSLASGAARKAAPRSTGRPAARRRWAAAGVAAAAVGVATLVGLESLTGGAADSGLPLAVSPAAAAQLHMVSRAAAGQVMPAAGQFEYVETIVHERASVSAGNATVDFTTTATGQSWTASSGEVRERATQDSFSFASPQDRANYLADKPAFGRDITSQESFTGTHYDGISRDPLAPTTGQRTPPAWETSPPTDPKTLIADITANEAAGVAPLPSGQHTTPAATTSTSTTPAATTSASMPPAATSSAYTPPAATSSTYTPPAATSSAYTPPAGPISASTTPAGPISTSTTPPATTPASSRLITGFVWNALSSILADSTSAQLRSTAYAALAYLPGTKVLGNQTDLLGRSGVAISFDRALAGGGETLIVDPSTGALLESDQTFKLLPDAGPPETIDWRTVFVKRAIVGSDTALPGGGSQPFDTSTKTTGSTR